jgi:carbonic anhydrase/acetyltransferase-like protein (isoleucine patch superfamily)
MHELAIQVEGHNFTEKLRVGSSSARQLTVKKAFSCSVSLRNSIFLFDLDFLAPSTMALIKAVKGVSPQFGTNCYLAENATVVGDVIMGNDCSIWFNAVVRGDVNSIRLGNRVNIQDGAVIHCTYQRTKATLGNDVSVGHNALVHGCTIHDNVLVGMGAIVMDDAVIHSHSIVAAGAVVLEGTVVESYSIYAGIPAKKVKTMDPEKAEKMLHKVAENYVMYAGWFKED